MQFRILGPVEIHDERQNRRIVPTGSKQRALIATLVVKAGRPLPTPRLIDELWGENPPANAVNALQAHIARLRRLIPRERHEPERILTTAAGYILRLGQDETDAAEFHRLSASGRAAVTTDPDLAAPVDRERRAVVHPLPSAMGRGTTGHTGTSGSTTQVLDPRGELALLRRRLDTLAREQEALVRRFNQLTGPTAGVSAL